MAAYTQGQQQQPYYGNYQTDTIPQQVPQQQQQHVQAQKPVLPRSISTTNLDTTTRCRGLIQQDWIHRPPMGGTNFFTSTPCYTFTLPSLVDYPPEFQQFVFDRLIDKETQRFLEGEHCLNWCRSAEKLLPLFTMGDGNCLLHAASLGMWGFQDRDLVLRKAISQALMSHAQDQNTLNQRWRYSRQMENKQQGLQLDPHQWDQEWQTTVQLASTEPLPGKPLESLEEFHVFVLANVLRRPIIMYAGPKIRSAVSDMTLQTLNFHGIYLPLLWDPKSCKKDPLPLAYYGGHFSALSVVDTALKSQGGIHLTLPLCDYFGQILPVRYALPMEDTMTLLMDYLHLIQVAVNDTSPYITAPNIICAKLSIPEVPKYLKPMISGFIDACWEAYGAQQRPTGTTMPPQGANAYQQQSTMPQQGFQQQTTMPQQGGNTFQQQTTRPQQGGNMFQQQPVRANSVQSSGGGGAMLQQQGGASSKRLPCVNKCGLFGHPDQADMCSDCYRKALESQQQYQQNQSQATGGGGGAMIQQGAQQQQGPAPEAKKCVNGCDAYGRSDQYDMCSTCYRKAHDAARAQEKANLDKQQEQQQQFQSQSQQQNQQGGSLPSGAIKCPHCSNPGQPMLLGMCDTCYNRRSSPKVAPAATNAQQQQSPPRGNKNPIYESLKAATQNSQPGPQPPALPPPRGQEPERSKCRMPNCDFFGTRQTRFYCSQCFEKNMDKILQEADNDPRPPQPPSQAAGLPQQQRALNGGFGGKQQVSAANLPQPPEYARTTEMPTERAKCKRCNDFYGDAEIGGYCTQCFMEMTKLDAQTPPQKQFPAATSSHSQRTSTDVHFTAQPNRVPQQMTAPQYAYSAPKCANCSNPATGGSNYCPACSMSQNLPEPAVNRPPGGPPLTPQGGDRPVPKPRRQVPNEGYQGRGITTAPVNVQQFQQQTASPTRCFICSGGADSGVGTNEVCDEHRKVIMTQVFPIQTAQSPPPPAVNEREIVRQKPANNYENPAPTTSPNHQPYMQQGETVRQKNVGYEHSSPVRSPPGNPNYPYTRPAGTNAASDPSLEYGVPLNDPPPRARYQEQHQQQHVQQQRHGYGGQQNVMNQGQYRPDVSQPSQPRPNLSANPNQHQQQHYLQSVTDIHPTHKPPGTYNPNPPYQHGATGQHSDPSRMGGAAGGMGVASGGMGGASGAGGAQGMTFDEPLPPAKELCAFPGCSFKGYRDLYGLCPDCYEAKYKEKVSPEQYPLV